MMSDEQKAVGYLKRALVDLNETRRRLEEAENRFTEPIAIVGMSCRYPGGVTSPEDLWELVSAGKEGVTDLPEDRGWDLDSLRDPDADDSATGFRGGFIQAGHFDAEFFGIPEHQGLMMDPQQRLLLETAWEACEDAGIDPTALRGSNTGVFIGLSVHSYASWLLGAVSESPEGYITSGNAGSMASGRVASMLGLEGPAVTVDTACSSSAMALHLACQSLRMRECTMAITGGVTIMSTPWMYAEFSRQALFPLSADGRCKSFADSADGAAFSEGIGVIMLERLADAQRLGHEVLAVVRGSAVNQDGFSNGLTAPNGLAHERVIRQALESSGVSAGQVDAVEGHGMGTVLGDPIEAQALLTAYGRDRDSNRPLWLGSIKSNIGHTQAASTVAGVIKMVMAMRHRLLPKTLHVDAPTRHVDWSSGAVSLLVDPVPWEKPGDIRRAAVHALGISGTNVHIILEESASVESPTEDKLSQPAGVGVGSVVPWIVSGRGHGGLRRQARHLADFIAAHPELDLADIGHSLIQSRAQLAQRAVVVGADREQLLNGLEGVADGQAGLGSVEGVVSGGRDDVAFVVGNGGTQWIETALALSEQSPIFAAEIELIDQKLSTLLDWSLLDVLRGGTTGLERPGAPYLLDFAVAASLAALWRACGVKPSAVVGHGPGEIVAAHIAGSLTLEDALHALTLSGDPQSPVIGWQPTGVSLWSASTGEPRDAMPPSDALSHGAEGEPSKLDEVVQALLTQGYRAFVEISPAQVVSHAHRTEAIAVPAAPRDEQGLRGVFLSLGQLWTAGIAVDWAAVFAGAGTRRVRLPTYVFDNQRYWPDRSPIWDSGGLMTEQKQRDNAASQAETHQIGVE